MPDLPPHTSSQLRHLHIASYVLIGLGLSLVLFLHLLPCLIAGLFVFELVNTLTPRLQTLIAGERARWLAVVLLGTLIVGSLILLVLGAVSFIRYEVSNPTVLFNKFTAVIDGARHQLPESILSRLPESVDEFQNVLAEWAKSHVGTLQLLGKSAAHTTVTILIGMVLGAMVALRQTQYNSPLQPLAQELTNRLHHFATAFHDIVFAQIKISLINTLFTGIFLVGVLPLMGIHLPLVKTLIVITFVAGLLPVVGNLISNTIIFVVGLSVSLWVAALALGFLIIIHKFEYFLNARIVGAQIQARAWELLLAMLVMEAAFGLPGLVAAPIFYAYLKRELKQAKLI